MRATEVQELDVYKGQELLGRLSRTTDGSIFHYHEPDRTEAIFSVGLSFGTAGSNRPVVTRGVNLHPFFAGLLPEGIRLSALTRRVKTSSDDLFSLLVAIGSDCIGDIAVVESGEKLESKPALVDALSPEELDFAELLQRTLDPEAASLDLSLPGVQEKISGAMISLPLSSRSKDAAFILKLDPPDRPKLVENEAFFLDMARACGLDTADSKLIHDRHGKAGLLVTRFDRVFEKAKPQPEKLHQEDACQFLGRYPADKYRLSAQEIMEGIDEFASAPIVEKRRFLELYAFSYLIGNGDLHAKNVSLIRRRKGLVTLSPAYDLLSTQAYRGLDQHMAMKLGAKDDEFKARDFIKFGERNGVREASVEKLLQRLCSRAAPFVDRVAEIGLPEADRKRVAHCLETRIKRLS